MEYITEHGESWRVDRLVKSAKVFCTIVGINRKQLDLLVDRLVDNKGELLVYWLELPTERFMRSFEDAWHLCGEQSSWHFSRTTSGGYKQVEGWEPCA